MDQNTEVLDLSALDRLRKMTGGDEEFLSELIQTFLESAPQEIARMRQALENQNAELLCLAAHSLKANGAEFGAHKLQQMCQHLEEMGKQKVLEGAAQQLSEIEAEYTRVDTALRTVRQTPQASQTR
jgi:HPt (histidine-containing phosphotransfer) domain-containing protein